VTSDQRWDGKREWTCSCERAEFRARNATFARRSPALEATESIESPGRRRTSETSNEKYEAPYTCRDKEGKTFKADM